jgi:hypothetical protein
LTAASTSVANPPQPCNPIKGAASSPPCPTTSPRSSRKIDRSESRFVLGNAGLRWLDRPEPNLEEAGSAFGRVANEGHRAAPHRKLSGDVAKGFGGEIADFAWRAKESSGFARATALEDLTPAQADRVQLQQVLLNLLQMLSTLCRRHRSSSYPLCAFRTSRGLGLVSVQDSGTGIAPEHAERMFDASSRPNQMALG